ncbi:hypothetical protein GGR61_002880 [Xanthomonas arboricola]|nr:hypothetical protein [Xanthomonas sp. 3058]
MYDHADRGNAAARFWQVPRPPLTELTDILLRHAPADGLRVHEARRLMVADALNAADAGFRVGYESASQFSRDYACILGGSPTRDTQRLRAIAQEAALTWRRRTWIRTRCTPTSGGDYNYGFCARICARQRSGCTGNMMLYLRCGRTDAVEAGVSSCMEPSDSSTPKASSTCRIAARSSSNSHCA